MALSKIAIVGAGYWGVNYVRMFQDLLRSANVLVCDQQRERLDEIGKRFPDVEVTDSLDEVLERAEVGAAVVCTPATTHFDVARRLLLSGKHLLVEKPLTKIAAHSEELVELAISRNLILMVGHTFIHNPGIQKVKHYVDRGDLGRLYYLYSQRTNLGPIRKDVNAIWDLAPHDISIFNYLMGSAPEWVSAVGSRVLRNGREDVGFITLGYPDGVLGHIHVSWADPSKVREVVVVGSDRRIVFDDLNIAERVRVFEKGVRATAPEEISSYGEYQVQMRDGDIISPKIEGSEPLKNQCLHFMDCVENGTEPLTNGRSGLDVVRVMEAIDRSVAVNGAPVEVAPGGGVLQAVGPPEERHEAPLDIGWIRQEIESARNGDERKAS